MALSHLSGWASSSCGAADEPEKKSAVCGAPHLFIAHERCAGKWAEDSKVNCIIATAYFDLLCNVHGLGAAIMSYPSEVLNELAPAARATLNIPRDHYTGLIVGFGYPEIKYARGVQKDRTAM